MKAPSRTRVYIAILCIIVAVAVTIVVAQSLYAKRIRLATQQEERAVIDAALREIHMKFFEVIVEDNGLLPEDPYVALLAHGKVSHISELLVGRGSLPVFNVTRLPVRLSTNMAANAKLVLFSYVDCEGNAAAAFTDGSFAWYADSDTVRSQFSIVWSATTDLLEKAGYPQWANAGAKSDWAKANLGRLTWDEGLRMYVLNEKRQ